jgi:EAL domain-containing protein (putative c-di-GMP-specific phosphodiesterase class I)
VIAEGVETRDQLDVLRNIECSAIQGYFLSRPLAADAYERFCIAQQHPAAARRGVIASRT